MLSEKAKGKQRALEPPADSVEGQATAESEEQEWSQDIVVRFTEGVSDLTVTIRKHDLVRDVKKTIRDSKPELNNRRLRLIHSGRLLTDGTSLYGWFNSLQDRQKRSSADQEESTKSPPPQASTIWLHCSIGASMTAGEEEDSKAQTPQIQPLRGFDRLSAVGFSAEDIENFRRQFHSQSSSNYLDTDFETEEEYEEHARLLEEQWIDSIDNAGTATLSQSSSSNSAVLQGILVGFFFPFLPLFFMRGQKPASFWEDGSEQPPNSNVIFSRRMQMGLVVGFLVNILFGLWRMLLDSS